MPRSRILELSFDRLKLLNASRKQFAGSASSFLSDDRAADPNTQIKILVRNYRNEAESISISHYINI